MKRIGLIGAAVALMAFASAGVTFAEQGHKQEDHNRKHDQQDKKSQHENKQAEPARASGAPEQARARQRQDVPGQKAGESRQGQQAQQNQQAERHATGRQLSAQHEQQLALQNQQAKETQATRRSAQQQQTLRVQREQTLTAQQQRAAQYQQTMAAQAQLAQAQANQIAGQNRRAQALNQAQYARNVQLQEVQFRNERNYNAGTDPYFSAPMQYGYAFGGQYHQTNRYGVSLLQQAVNRGYLEGYRAGGADRRDRWGYQYQDSFAYRDANYGYNGRYVDQSDYNYYFRQGFQKGYDDGYYARVKYGRRVNGNITILQIVMTRILSIEVIR